MKIEYSALVNRLSGRFGGAVASQWQGVPTVRRFTPPSQPRTADQLEVRRIFRGLNRFWLNSQAYLWNRNTWTNRARGAPGTGRNFFIGYNLPELQGETDMAKFRPWSPSRELLPASMAVVATPGTDSLVCVMTPGSEVVPADYTRLGAIIYVTPNSTPNALNYAPLYVANVSSASGATIDHTFSGLVTGQEYVVGAVMVYTATPSTGDPVRDQRLGIIGQTTGTPT